MSERFYQAFHTELASDTTASLAHTHGLNDAYTRLICDRDIHDDDALASYECAFLTRFTCNSAAIEGSTLNGIDTQLVLEGEFVPRDQKEVSDMFTVRGVAEGYGYAMSELSTGRVIDAGFPPVALKNANRRAYLSTLMAAQIEGDFNPLITFAITELQAEITGRATIVLQTREHTRPQARSDDARQP